MSEWKRCPDHPELDPQNPEKIREALGMLDCAHCMGNICAQDAICSIAGEYDVSLLAVTEIAAVLIAKSRVHFGQMRFDFALDYHNGEGGMRYVDVDAARILFGEVHDKATLDEYAARDMCIVEYRR